MALVLYHNPRCSKSRATLALLRERGLEPQIVEYLIDPPSQEDILRIIGQLDVPAMDLVRAGDAAFAASGLAPQENEPAAIARALAAHPALLQRPIVVHDGQARIGRPPERVSEIL